MPTATPLQFELCYRREVYKVVRGHLVREEEKDSTLPERPPQFTPMRDFHGAVQDRASDLNGAQLRSGFMHYFFYPEVIGANKPLDPSHCAACKDIHEKRS